MDHDPTFLREVWIASVNGYFKDFYPGCVVARGVADLGFEEFILLPGEKQIVSLDTGKGIDWDKSVAERCFVIPTFDEIIAVLAEIGISITGVMRSGTSRWYAVDQDDVRYQEALSPVQAVLRALLSVKGLTRAIPERALRIEGEESV